MCWMGRPVGQAGWRQRRFFAHRVNRRTSCLAAAESRRRRPKSDEAARARPVQPFQHGGAADAGPQPIGHERKGQRVDRREADKRRLRDDELRQDGNAVVDELRDESDEEGDAVGIESRHHESVAEDPARPARQHR